MSRVRTVITSWNNACDVMGRKRKAGRRLLIVLCAVVSAQAASPIFSLALDGEIRLTGHDYDVTTAIFSPDGSRVLTQCAKRILVHDTASGERVLTLNAPSNNDHGAAYSPDGKHIAAVYAGNLTVFDSSTGKEVFATKDRDPSRFANGVAAYSPNGKLLVVSDAVVDPSNAAPIFVFRNQGDEAVRFSQRALFTPNGRSLLDSYSVTCTSSARIFQMAVARP